MTTTTSMFAVTVTGTYTRDEIPPRCRNPRPVTHQVSTTVRVPVVSAEQAPVAFHIRTDDATYQAQEPTVFRYWGGHLYVPWAPSVERADVHPGDPMFEAEQSVERHALPARIDSKDAFDLAVEEKYGTYLIIDGVVWESSGEPRYVIQTFGLGANHGGTGVFVDTFDRSNIDATAIFRADEMEAAVAYAAEVAADRGDTKDVAWLKTNGPRWTIDVLIPEAVTLVTVPPEPKEVRGLRWTYRLAVAELDRLLSREATTPQQEVKAVEKIARLRHQIINAGCSPIAPTARPYEAR